jgi:multiple sugar transport system permease protein
VGIALSLVFAYLLNAKLRAQRWWRFLYFAPMVTGVVSVALIFSLLFLDSKLGLINAALLKFGLIKDPILFLSSDRTFLPCVMALAIWQGLAFTILIFLAGLQQIPQEMYEAAEMDGAGEIGRFWNIAVPGLRPQVFFVTVLGCIGGLQVFDTIYTLAGKSGGASARFGPNDAGETVVPLLYHYGFETFEMGKSSAVAYVLFVLILVLTMVQLRLYRRGEI